MPTKYINADGHHYAFTPGKDGSLIAMDKVAKAKPITPSLVAKVVPCINCGEPVSGGADSCLACGSYQVAKK